MFTCMKSQLLDGMKARFEDDLTDAVVVLSALLDPRQKLDVFECKTYFVNHAVKIML